MIKKFNEYINEDYFSKLASRKDGLVVRKENEITEDFVRSFVLFEDRIKSISFRKENGKTVVDIDGDFVLGGDMEEIPFQFGKVTGEFVCTYCTGLKTLEGCPHEVGGTFSCAHCKKLTSLIGCPKEVGGNFDCYHCHNLTSLEGCPKEVGGGFNCAKCDSLTSLEGCPEKVSCDFNCSACDNLELLEGCPKEVGGNFVCRYCGIKFTENEAKSLCNVKGYIGV